LVDNVHAEEASGGSGHAVRRDKGRPWASGRGGSAQQAQHPM
jgi:hypothetical protein